MPENYVLIDYENVQPKNLTFLDQPDFHIRVFIGANQEKLSTKIATQLQSFGANAAYIQISGNGKNAADFHIAYYLGQFATRPDVTFYVVTKDKGFDPLMKHLQSQDVSAKRVSDINHIPVLKSHAENSTEGKVDRIVCNLRARGNSRPKKEATLRNTINTLFDKELSGAEMNNIIGRMKNLGHLTVAAGSVSYQLN